MCSSGRWIRGSGRRSGPDVGLGIVVPVRHPRSECRRLRSRTEQCAPRRSFWWAAPRTVARQGSAMSLTWSCIDTVSTSASRPSARAQAFGDHRINVGIRHGSRSSRTGSSTSPSRRSTSKRRRHFATVSRCTRRSSATSPANDPSAGPRRLATRHNVAVPHLYQEQCGSPCGR